MLEDKYAMRRPDDVIKYLNQRATDDMEKSPLYQEILSQEIIQDVGLEVYNQDELNLYYAQLE